MIEDETAIEIEVINCARCGNTHMVKFKKFVLSVVCGDEIMTHWGMCLNLNEPILMRIEETNENI